MSIEKESFGTRTNRILESASAAAGSPKPIWTGFSRPLISTRPPSTCSST